MVEEPFEENEDVRLMVRLSRGDQEAFDVLIKRYEKRVINLAYRYLNGDREGAEDVAQEVFIKIYNSSSTYRPTAKFSTWLYRIAVNVCLNELRKRKVRSLFQFPLFSDKEEPRVVRDRGEENEEEVIEKIRSAVDSLPSTQKMAIILKKYDELSLEEIAETMNISLSSVKSLIFRGMTTLRKKLNNP